MLVRSCFMRCRAFGKEGTQTRRAGRGNPGGEKGGDRCGEGAGGGGAPAMKMMDPSNILK